MEEQPLVRHRSRHTSSGSGESAKEVGVTEVSSPPSPGQPDVSSPPRPGQPDVSSPPRPGQPDVSNQPQHNGNAFPSDEVSSLHILIKKVQQEIQFTCVYYS